MSWKQKGISLCRRAITDRLFQTSSMKQVLSFGQKSEMKIRRQSSDCCQSEYKSLFDEAPVPEGSWSENFKKMDDKNNRVLGAGVLSLLFTMAWVRKRGLVKGHPEISLFG